MKYWSWGALALSTAVTLGGCAWTDVKPVSPCDVRNRRGFVIYDQMPVLIVDHDDAAVVMRIATIPNMDKPRIVNNYAILASGSMELSLQNGVLAGASSSADTTAILPYVAQALAGGAEGARFAGTNKRTHPAAGLKPGVYEIVFDGNGHICGLKPIHCNILDCAPPVQ